MTPPAFLTSPRLNEGGFEHGFGTRRSEGLDLKGLALAKQVHGVRLLRVPPVEPRAEADALFTTHPGLAVGVRTADCVPLLLVDAGRRGVAAVHAGWRGSAAQIAERAARAFAVAIGVDVSDLVATLGPHIGSCCYEVDGPVREAVGEAGVFRAGRRPGRYWMDLFELNRRQLLRAGIAAERIERVGGCTACEPELFSSYRRDGSRGRMLHWVRMPLS